MKKILFIYLCITLVLNTGCSKDDAEEPQETTPVVSSCQVSEALSYQNDKLQVKRTFEYDAATKKLIRHIHTRYNSSGVATSVLTLDYSYPNASTVIISGSDKYGFVLKSTITLNDKKLATHVRLESDQTGTNWEETAYEYNGEQLIKSTTTRSTGLETEAGYEWSNGNLIRQFTLSDNTTQVEWEYYSDQNRRGMDALVLSDFATYSWETVRNKHQVKGIKGNSTYTYTYDANGETSKMTSFLINTNLTTNWEFKYVNCQ